MGHRTVEIWRQIIATGPPSATTLAQRNEELLKAKQELLEINQTRKVKIAERTINWQVEAHTDSLTALITSSILKFSDWQFERCSPLQTSLFQIIDVRSRYF